MDLFDRLTPPCGDCHQLGDAIDSGIRYCWGALVWRWATDHVPDCPYRDRPPQRPGRPTPDREAAIRDLLESPRHSIKPKGRAWLRAQLNGEERGWPLTEDSHAD